MNVTFNDIGEQRVKNIERPIRVHRVDLGRNSNVPSAGAALASGLGFRSWRVAAAIGGLALLGIGVWSSMMARKVESTATAPPFSIAVLPFTASPNDASAADRAARLTTDLTTALTTAYNRRGYVVSPGGTGAQTTDVRTIGRDFNVANLVQGDITRADGSLVVSLRLVDTATGMQLWGESTSFSAADLSADPAMMVKRSAWHLRGALRKAEVNRASRRPSSQRPIDLVMRGYAARDRSTEMLQGIIQARKLFDEALRLDPEFVPAMIALVDALHWELYENPAADQTKLIDEMDMLTRRAIAVGDDNSQAWGLRAETLPWLGRLDEAFAAAERIRALDPNDLDYLGTRSWLTFLAGRPDESLATAQEMVRINPPGEAQEAIMLCRSHLFLGRYGDAVSACERATTFLDASWRNYLVLAAAYAQHGDLDKAKATLSELQKRQPGYTIAKDKARPFSINPEFLRLLELHFYSGLRKAGLPEQ